MLAHTVHAMRALHTSKPLLAAACLGAALAACRDEPRSKPAPLAATSASATSAPAPAKQRAPVHEGGPLARAVGEEALYIADEDRSVIRRVPLPADINTPPGVVKMPGAPAAVLALDGRVLVTIRDPGLLLILRPDKDQGLVEVARVPLPADAWGLAVTPDESIALVTSAWTHAVSAVDLASAKKLWTLDVAREPRGVVVRADGKAAYVTHLTRASLTRIDDLAGAAKAHDVPFPAAPIRTMPERAEAAKLGYAPVLSPDGTRLFVARQALGALGKRAWNGQATVDVLLTADETTFAVKPPRNYVMWSGDFMKSDAFILGTPKDHTTTGPGPTLANPPFFQPRAALYRKRSRTLLVASEGSDALVELDALSIDPSTHALHIYRLKEPPPVKDAFGNTSDTMGETHCGGPSGVALSADEGRAFVWCHASRDLAIVDLDVFDEKAPFQPSPIPSLPIGDDPLSVQGALGRRLFHDATDTRMSDGYACAGCHPEGRDDGHVWHEDEEERSDENGKKRWEEAGMHAYEMALDPETGFGGLLKGSPRQTPMLAGRVSAQGPYGWKGRSPSLRHRAVMGFSLHRWLPVGGMRWGEAKLGERADALAEFLRKGLAPPPREAHEPTAEEQRGKAVFSDPNVGCAECHAPASEYTNRARVGLGAFPVDKQRFDPEGEDDRFKTPSLSFIAGTAPYFHDGSEATLEDLIEHNGDRMGHTKHLSREDRAALVAFLKTL